MISKDDAIFACFLVAMVVAFLSSLITASCVNEAWRREATANGYGVYENTYQGTTWRWKFPAIDAGDSP